MEPSFTVIDGHQLWVEADVLCTRASGPMTPAIVDWIVAACTGMVARHSDYYILGNLRDAGPIPADLRRRIVDFARLHPPRAIAFFHVTPLALGVNALLFGAINAFRKRKIPLKQFASEAEARAWLISQRPSLPPSIAG